MPRLQERDVPPKSKAPRSLKEGGAFCIDAAQREQRPPCASKDDKLKFQVAIDQAAFFEFKERKAFASQGGKTKTPVSQMFRLRNSFISWPGNARKRHPHGVFSRKISPRGTLARTFPQRTRARIPINQRGPFFFSWGAPIDHRFDMVSHLEKAYDLPRVRRIERKPNPYQRARRATLLL